MPQATAPEPAGVAELAIDVAALRRRGIDRHEVAVELPTQWLAETLSDTDASTPQPGRVQVELFLPTDGAVVAHCRLELEFEVPCGRCLQPAAVDGSVDLNATFVLGSSLPASGPQGQDEGEEGLGLSDDDLDTWLYDGTTVDLGQVVAEYVKLAYPMRALCRLGEACQGLCSNCGADLNERPPAGGRCQACNREVVPITGEPVLGDSEGPLADALRKLQLD